MEYVLKAEAEEIKDVKKNPTMKLSVVFHSTYAKVKELLESVRRTDEDAGKGMEWHSL